ncbi:MAG: GxxExxY protein, partial [Verrucomicrobia bacterium]|nr:GxxExxY protein [Verrucomicrobiota bacterium]
IGELKGINHKERKERREGSRWQQGVGGVPTISRWLKLAQFSLRFSLRSLRSLRLNQWQMKDIKALCDQVRQVAYDIHVYHGHGHLEKVYENALAHRLRKAGFDAKQQHPIKVYDEDGTLIGDYLADLLVAGELIGELKETIITRGSITHRAMPFIPVFSLPSPCNVCFCS